MSNSLLIIFVRNPIKGKVKTRLAKDIGDEKALEVYKSLLKHTHEITKNLNVSKEVHYAEHIEKNDLWDSPDFMKKVQKAGGLGISMSSAFHDGFDNNYQSVCIIGSDCYDLSTEILKEAFYRLKSNDFVIGPANDGGYYLLGMNTYTPQVFENKTYSTSNVLQEAIEEIGLLGKSYFVLPELTDIDNIADLKKFM